jgi:hypothetical protein
VLYLRHNLIKMVGNMRCKLFTKFQGIIKSLYTCVFKKAHVFNETLSLEFAHVIVTKALE